MAFIEKGQEIDIEAIKAETQLSVEALRLKERRDRELADIISGEDRPYPFGDWSLLF